MPLKSQHQIDTVSKVSMKRQGHHKRVKHLDLDGINMKKCTLTGGKITTLPISVLKIPQQTIKVHFNLQFSAINSWKIGQKDRDARKAQNVY